MIKINLLKKEKQTAQPAVPKKQRAEVGSGKKKIYGIALIAALGFLIYTYLPTIVDYLYKSTAPPVPIGSVQIKRDTAKQQTVVTPDTVIPAQPAETKKPTAPQKPPVQEKPVVQTQEETPVIKRAEPEKTSPPPQIKLSQEIVPLSQQVNAYMALRKALQNEGSYSLLAVDGNRIFSEIQSSSQEALVRFTQNLRRLLPGNSVRLSPGKSGSNSNSFEAMVLGSYRTDQKRADEQSMPAFSAQEVVRKISGLARKNGFTLTFKQIGESVFGEDAVKTPLILKFKGSEDRSLLFLTAFRKESLNCQLLKIAGMPFSGTGTITGMIPDLIQIVIIMDVLMPMKG